MVRGLESRIGHIRIEFSSAKPDCLQCVIVDDGIGRKLSEERKSQLPDKKSRGIGIVTERLKIINHLRNSECQVKIEDLLCDQSECGTKVTIDIPVKTI